MPEENEKAEEKEEKEEEGSGPTLDDVKDLIDEALEPFRKLLGSDDNSNDGGDGSDGDKNKKEGEPSGRRVRRSFANVEHDAEETVKNAVKAVLGEIEHEKEHASLKNKKEETQSAPVKPRRLSQFMLGKNYADEK